MRMGLTQDSSLRLKSVPSARGVPSCNRRVALRNIRHVFATLGLPLSTALRATASGRYPRPATLRRLTFFGPQRMLQQASGRKASPGAATRTVPRADPAPPPQGRPETSQCAPIALHTNSRFGAGAAAAADAKIPQRSSVAAPQPFVSVRTERHPPTTRTMRGQCHRGAGPKAAAAPEGQAERSEKRRAARTRNASHESLPGRLRGRCCPPWFLRRGRRGSRAWLARRWRARCPRARGKRGPGRGVAESRGEPRSVEVRRKALGLEDSRGMPRPRGWEGRGKVLEDLARRRAQAAASATRSRRGGRPIMGHPQACYAYRGIHARSYWGPPVKSGISVLTDALGGA